MLWIPLHRWHAFIACVLYQTFFIASWVLPLEIYATGLIVMLLQKHTVLKRILLSLGFMLKRSWFWLRFEETTFNIAFVRTLANLHLLEYIEYSQKITELAQVNRKKPGFQHSVVKKPGDEVERYFEFIYFKFIYCVPVHYGAALKFIIHWIYKNL